MFLSLLHNFLIHTVFLSHPRFLLLCCSFSWFFVASLRFFMFAGSQLYDIYCKSIAASLTLGFHLIEGISSWPNRLKVKILGMMLLWLISLFKECNFKERHPLRRISFLLMVIHSHRVPKARVDNSVYMVKLNIYLIINASHVLIRRLHCLIIWLLNN